jgi:hypothetical protein
LPLRGSPAPIGYIYDATPDADGGLLAAALAFFSHQGHQVFHNPCPDLAAYCRSRGVVSLVVPVDRLPDHILASGLELLDGLFAPSPTDSGTAFMVAYLASPPSATLPTPSGDRSVASGLGSTRGVGSVIGGWGPCTILCCAHGGSRRPWGDIRSFGGPPWPSARSRLGPGLHSS